MGTVHDQDLPEITGVGKDLLITGHSGVETDLAGGGANGPKGKAPGQGSIGQ